jgi:cytochrome c oxidase cbb3-type subunit 3
MNATNHTRLATLTLPLCLTAALVSACTQHTPAPAVASTAPPAVAYPSHEAAGGIVPPGGALHNPHAGDKLVAATGAQLFTTMNCDGCHGPDASGAVGPNLGDGRWRYGGADPEVFMSIYYGRPKGMPAFGGVLGEDGVWQLVTYLRSLPPPPNLPTQSWEKP